MAIELRFLTALIRKDAVAASFPGGLAGFRRTHPEALEDESLFAIRSLSGGELNEALDDIAAAGLDLGACCAVGDMWGGPFTPCDGIAFERIESESGLPRWLARLGA